MPFRRNEALQSLVRARLCAASTSVESAVQVALLGPGAGPEQRLLELRAEDDAREDFGARILERPSADGGHGALDDVHIARWQTRKDIAMLAPSHFDGLRVGDPDRRAVLNVELEASRERGELIE